MNSKALVYTSNGTIATVLSVATYAITSDLEPNQVLLQILAGPINAADVLIVEGLYPVKPNFKSHGAVGGNEGLAKIIAVGAQVSDFKEGDWVIPTGQTDSFGTWQTHAKTNSNHIAKLPDCTGISPVLAATIAVNPITDFASLQPGDAVIQNASTSAVGQAVIQLAKAWGLKTINVIRDRPDLAQVKAQLHSLGADLVVTEEEICDSETIALIAKIGPLQLALNCVGGKSATNMAVLLSENAHLVTYGGLSKEPVTIPTTLFIFKHLTCSGFWLNQWNLRNPGKRMPVIEELFDLARSGKFKEPANTTVSFGEGDAVLVGAVGKWASPGKMIFVP